MIGDAAEAMGEDGREEEKGAEYLLPEYLLPEGNGSKGRGWAGGGHLR